MNTPIIRIALIGLLACAPALAIDTEGLNREALYSQFRAAHDQENWAEARDWAQALVVAKETELGKDSPELIVSLINLTQMDLMLGDWVSAQEHAGRTVDLIDATPGTDDGTRMIAIMQLAEAHVGRRDKKKAERTLNAALALSKRLDDKLQQADICRMQIDLAKQRRMDVEKAYKNGNRATGCMLKASEAAYGKHALELVAGLHEAANWYRFSTQLSRERKTRQRALDIMEANYGPTDPRLATDLRAIAHSYMLERRKPKEVRKLLDQAVAIEYSDSVSGTFNKAMALTDHGDFYVLFEEPADGLGYYEKAWKLLANHPEIGSQQANEYFRNVKELYLNEPKEPARKDSKGGYYVPNGYIEVEFTVTAQGTVEDFEILRARPLEMEEKLFRKAFGRARYRPRIFMGETVATDGVYRRINYSGSYEVEFR